LDTGAVRYSIIALTINAIDIIVAVIVYTVVANFSGIRIDKLVGVIAISGDWIAVTVQIIIGGGRITVIIFAVVRNLGGTRIHQWIRVIAVTLVFRIVIAIIVNAGRTGRVAGAVTVVAVRLTIAVLVDSVGAVGLNRGRRAAICRATALVLAGIADCVAAARDDGTVEARAASRVATVGRAGVAVVAVDESI
jgi:hypothetical protein